MHKLIGGVRQYCRLSRSGLSNSIAMQNEATVRITVFFLYNLRVHKNPVQKRPLNHMNIKHS